MNTRGIGLTLIVVGIAVAAVARQDSIVETTMNAALTGLSVVLLAIGLYLLWKARAKAGNTDS